MERKYRLVSEEYLSKIEDNNEEILSQIKQLNEKVNLLGCSDSVIGTKIKAAEFIGYDHQSIDTLINAGRIINCKFHKHSSTSFTFCLPLISQITFHPFHFLPSIF